MGNNSEFVRKSQTAMKINAADRTEFQSLARGSAHRMYVADPGFRVCFVPGYKDQANLLPSAANGNFCADLIR
jgi:hypothetical protein